jgi:hypothetical protein
MQLLARLEAHRLAGSDADLGSGSRIASDAGLSRPHAEHAKPAQFDPLARSQRLLQSLKNRVYGGLCLGARQTRTFDHLMDDVLFDQGMHLASRAARIAIANRINSQADGDEAPYIAYITDIAAISKPPNLSPTPIAGKSRFVYALCGVRTRAGLAACSAVADSALFSAAASVVNRKTCSVR